MDETQTCETCEEKREGYCVCVDLKILMGGMPDCQEENWELKEQGC